MKFKYTPEQLEKCKGEVAHLIELVDGQRRRAMVDGEEDDDPFWIEECIKYYPPDVFAIAYGIPVLLIAYDDRSESNTPADMVYAVMYEDGSFAWHSQTLGFPTPDDLPRPGKNMLTRRRRRLQL